MPDLKISQLPVATTPLAGTELVPIVQGGVTDRTTVQAIMTSTVPSGTANGVLYLNGSKVATSGTDLVFNATGLGIGTSSPASKLNVVGGTANTWVQIDDGTVSGAIGEYAVSGVFNVGSVSNHPLGFRTNNTEQMRLDSSGNLGLGVTPSASWSSTLVKVFQIADNGCSISSYTTGNTSSKFLNLNNNAYYDAVGWKYIASSVATVRYELSNGEHRWYNAPSGTAGNAISFTQAMTLDASGRLLVGTTTAPLANTIQTVINGSNAGGIELVRNNSGGVAIVPSSGGGVEFVTFSGAIGSESYTERARITGTGNVIVGTAAIATTATDGFLYIPTCAGAPTGTPTAQTGRAPLVVDSTNNRFYVYVGGAWKYADLV